MTRDIFISHSSADCAAAEQICAYLEATGLSCWIAPRDIPPLLNPSGKSLPLSSSGAVPWASIVSLSCMAAGIC